MVLCAMASYSDSIEIATSLEAAFEAVSHLELMGRFSPENTGGKWLGSATGPAIGAKFKGTNAQGSTTWTTTAKVSHYEPPVAFAFDVSVGPVKVSHWSFRFEPTVLGCRVTELWVDRRSALAKKFGNTGIDDRESYTRESIRTTLENLRTFLEA